MGKVFFVDWALWQKMTFVLGCCIVLTIIGGFIKLAFDQRKLKKYSKVEAKGKAAQTPDMIESQRLEAEDDKEHIPFGIRAIESGIEVDGVWISRGNTPVGSVASSANNSRIDLHRLPGGSTNNSQLELPQPIHGSASRTSSRAPSSAFDRAVSAERLPDSRSSSPAFMPTDPRGRQPRGNSQVRNSSAVARNSTTLNALEGNLTPESASASTYQPTGSQKSNSSKSSRNSDESDYMQLAQLAASRPYEAAYLNPHDSTGAAPRDPRFRDLDLLQSHRMSHVAETGQLTPRVRRPGYSGEWASAVNNVVSPPEGSSAHGVEYFVPANKTPSPPMANAVLGPLDDYSNSAAHSSSSYDAHPNNTARQAMPLLETYQPRGPHDDYDGYSASYAQASLEQNESRPRRDSDVLRKVNEGFEILRPGTLQTSPPASPEDEKPDHERRQSKKLQKKRRASSGGSVSKTSHFVEQI